MLDWEEESYAGRAESTTRGGGGIGPREQRRIPNLAI